MNFFQTVQNLYQLMGIYSPQQHDSSSNVKIYSFLLSMIGSFIQSTGFLLNKAVSVSDYGTSFYASVTSLAVITGYAMQIWRRVHIFNLIKKYDAFIEKGKRD